MLEQLDAPQDEGAHEDFAQLAVALHQGEQVIARQLDDLAGLADAVADQARAAREDRDFAGEFAGLMPGDERLAVARLAQDFDRPREHDEERAGRIARLEQDFSGASASAVAVRRNAVDLGRREHREDLLTTRPGQREAFRSGRRWIPR